MGCGANIYPTWRDNVKKFNNYIEKYNRIESTLLQNQSKKMDSLMELYEAQALALNPFLANPSAISGQLNERTSVGPHMLAALLLDNLTGMGAASFTRKAISSKLLSDAEGTVLLSIVELAEPGDPDSALSDALPNRSLMTFITLLESWRSSRQLSAEG